MIKILITTVFLFLAIPMFGQDSLRASDIRRFAHPLKISGYSITGKGAEILKNRIKHSQFFLLGEQHESPQISELTNALLPELRSSGFGYFGIEVGPNSTEKMMEVVKSQNTLYDFNTNFHTKYGDIPIPFFDGRKDELFLKTALKEGFELWGLDQEYYTAHLFLIDELYDSSSAKLVIELFYRSAKTYAEKEFKNDTENKHYPLFTNLLSSPEIETFFEKCQIPRQRQIITGLRTS